MRGFGQYLMSGRLQAVVSISLLSMLAMFMTPLAYLLSGTPLGLVSLRRGPVIALQIACGCMLLVTLLLLVSGFKPTLAVAFALGIWLPVWFCASVLRTTESQGVMVVSTGLIGLVYIITTYVMFGDVQSMWRTVMFAWLENAMTPTKLDQVKPVMEQVIPYMNAAMASGIIASITLTVLLARWWQSWIYHPGGFRREFIALRLPKALLVVVAVSTLLLLISDAFLQSIAKDVLCVSLFLYVFQGVSVVHGVVAVRRLSRWWLFTLYFCLVFFALQAMLFVACIGISDSIFRLSSRQRRVNDDGNRNKEQDKEDFDNEE